ncbi:MAG: 50S ribosomal protein L4 [Thermoplasmata archaeon]
MNVNVFNTKGEKKADLKLPAPFSEEIRDDIIHRAVISMQSNRRQPYAPSSKAGMRHAVANPGKGRGIARVQRLTQYGNRAAESPNNVGGRRAHPPKVENDLGKKMNAKERKKARRSALAATANKNFIIKRGHKIEEKGLTFPVVLEKSVEDMQSTKEAVELLKSLGLWGDVERAKKGKKVRAGKGKMRNRRYKSPRSLLVVLPEESQGIKSFSNLPGVDVRTPDQVTVEDLAPGGDMGRLTIFSVRALNQVGGW